jgi:catechol 2,3-dioxygenase-like lactoylglutathione lyase family enzyme
LTGPARGEAVRLRLPDEGFEALLVQWHSPRSHGRHYAEPNHAGLFRSAVGVDDTKATYGAMSAAGWSFDREPMSVELKGTPVPDMWICFLRDPDGVPIELVGRPRSAFRS